MIHIPRRVVAAIRDHAETVYPHECCGVLAGDDAGADGAEKRIARAVPADNARQVDRERRYLIPPDEVRRIEADITANGRAVVGFYHSHPDHPAEPSAFDRDHAWPWYSYLIVAVRRGDAGPVRAWRLADDRSRFHEDDIVLTGEGP